MRPQGKDKLDTNSIGDISEMHVAIRLLELGYMVLVPYGGGQRCDLIIEDVEGKIWRVQCKTGRVDKNNTTLIFNTSIRNVTGKNRQPRDYRGQCDYFGVYCGKLNKVYLIPVDEVGVTTGWLPLASAKGPRRNIRCAGDYEL